VKFMRTQPIASQPDLRFSVYSLPYYMLGVLDMKRDTADPNSMPVDGFAGPGFRTVKGDGTFNTGGRVFQPFFDVSRGSASVYAVDGTLGKVELRDRNGVAFRYYRWERGRAQASQQGPAGTVVDLADLNVPMFLGDPAQNEQLKKARWAIVGAGPNGLFGNEEQLPGAGLPPG